MSWHVRGFIERTRVRLRGSRGRGAEHPRSLSTRSNLAAHAERQGDLQRALELDQVVLAGRRVALGDEHPDTLSSLFSVGGLNLELGRFDEAAGYLTEAYEIWGRILGPEHRLTLSALDRLAFLEERRDDPQLAAELYAEVYTLRARTLGDAHPSTLETLDDLAWISEQLGRLEQAEGFAWQALEATAMDDPERPLREEQLASIRATIEARGD